MAANFRIVVHRDSDSLHLKLYGDFDGTSACQLIDLLKNASEGIHSVIIHTNGVKTVYPFGRDVFHCNLRSLNGPQFQVFYTGGNEGRLAP
jgi:hypothetical protein